MPGPTFEVVYHEMRIGRLAGPFVVAKVERVSSPPVPADAPDARGAALARLADVLRAGPRTRAYSDFAAFKRLQGEDPAPEWQGYVAAACRAVGTGRLEPLRLGPLPDGPGGQ